MKLARGKPIGQRRIWCQRPIFAAADLENHRKPIEPATPSQPALAGIALSRAASRFLLVAPRDGFPRGQAS
jgi:hypothetical protein